MANQTKQDAFLRVLDAKTGSLADRPSMEYMEELRKQIQIWLDQVNGQIATVNWFDKSPCGCETDEEPCGSAYHK